MNVVEVCELLRANKLGEYVPLFEAEEVSHIFAERLIPVSSLPPCRWYLTPLLCLELLLHMYANF